MIFFFLQSNFLPFKHFPFNPFHDAPLLAALPILDNFLHTSLMPIFPHNKEGKKFCKWHILIRSEFQDVFGFGCGNISTSFFILDRFIVRSSSELVELPIFSLVASLILYHFREP